MTHRIIKEFGVGRFFSISDLNIKLGDNTAYCIETRKNEIWMLTLENDGYHVPAYLSDLSANEQERIYKYITGKIL